MTDRAALQLAGGVAFNDQWLFHDLILQLPIGQWTCLLGPSGVGKSTLLRLLADLPIGGRFDGRIEMTDNSVAPDKVAYMAQSDLLAPWLTVLDNVMLGPRLRGEKPGLEQATDLLERVGLADHATKRPRELSGGMRQRVALARTLMEQAPLVLLDEPFSALDARTRADMQELAFDLLGQSTVLLATHDPSEASRLAHQILIMNASGLQKQPVPDSAPVRATDDAQTISMQIALLNRLRQTQAV